MRFKVLYILAIVGLMSFSSYSQRGVRIGYIDTEYILQNVPDYKEANSQLETKLSKWKSEIEKRLATVETKKKALENEKVLLTKELYEERLEDISFEEAEVLDYQQKRFGPSGDMVIQRTQLIQPIQDQIFAAVKEIATNKKYDFVFDKNADFLMLYSAERFDISEQVLRIITRTNSRDQAKSKKELKALEKEDIIPEINRTNEERKAQREADLKQKRLEREKDIEERRKKQLEAREAKKKEANARRQNANAKNEKENTLKPQDSSAVKKSSVKAKTTEEKLEEKRAKALKKREDRQKKLEERKKKIAEQRKKAKEERLEQIRKNDSIRKAKNNN